MTPTVLGDVGLCSFWSCWKGCGGTTRKGPLVRFPEEPSKSKLTESMIVCHSAFIRNHLTGFCRGQALVGPIRILRALEDFPSPNEAQTSQLGLQHFLDRKRHTFPLGPHAKALYKHGLLWASYERTSSKCNPPVIGMNLHY